MKRLKILLITLLLLSLVPGLTGCDLTDQTKRHEHFIEWMNTIDLSDQTKLIIENTNGHIDVTGSDDTNSIDLTITKRVRSSSFEDAEQHIDEIVVSDEKRDQEVYIKVEHPSSDEREYEVDFTITLPTRFDFELICGNGLISLTSVTGNSVLTVGNGSIELINAKSTELNASVGNGSIDADIILVDDCNADFEVGNGEIKLKIPQDTNAKVDATSANGSITHSGLTFQDLQVSDTILSGRLGDGKASIKLTIGNGFINLQGK